MPSLWYMTAGLGQHALHFRIFDEGRCSSIPVCQSPDSRPRRDGLRPTVSVPDSFAADGDKHCTQHRSNKPERAGIVHYQTLPNQEMMKSRTRTARGTNNVAQAGQTSWKRAMGGESQEQVGGHFYHLLCLDPGCLFGPGCLGYSHNLMRVTPSVFRCECTGTSAWIIDSKPVTLSVHPRHSSRLTATLKQKRAANQGTQDRHFLPSHIYWPGTLLFSS